MSATHKQVDSKAKAKSVIGSRPAEAPQKPRKETSSGLSSVWSLLDSVKDEEDEEGREYDMDQTSAGSLTLEDEIWDEDAPTYDGDVVEDAAEAPGHAEVMSEGEDVPAEEIDEEDLALAADEARFANFDAEAAAAAVGEEEVDVDDNFEWDFGPKSEDLDEGHAEEDDDNFEWDFGEGTSEGTSEGLESSAAQEEEQGVDMNASAASKVLKNSLLRTATKFAKTRKLAPKPSSKPLEQEPPQEGGEQICWDFRKGFCARGKLCKYKHGSKQPVADAGNRLQPVKLEVPKPVRKNKKGQTATDDDICWDFTAGRCQKGDKCRYMHLQGDEAKAAALRALTRAGKIWMMKGGVGDRKSVV